MKNPINSIKNPINSIKIRKKSGKKWGSEGVGGGVPHSDPKYPRTVKTELMREFIY